METCLDQLDVFEFLSHIEDGLKDHYDIRVRALNVIVGALCACARMIIYWVIPSLYLMDCWQPRELRFTSLLCINRESVNSLSPKVLRQLSWLRTETETSCLIFLQMLTFLLLVRLSHLRPAALLQRELPWRLAGEVM